MTENRHRKYHAIILAAGYGTRLAPVTDVIPKPLVPVGNLTLLENILISLERAGVAEFAINTHHLGVMIIRAIENSDWRGKVKVYPEAEILGTGGPLVNAKDFLCDCDTFILHNSDILTDIDLGKLIKCHENNDSIVTMMLIDGPENKVAVNEDGYIVDILGKLGREQNYPKLTYAGIAVFSPEIFDYLPADLEFCSIIPAILAAIAENPAAASAYTPKFPLSELKSPNHQITKSSNIYWNDLGTVEKFLDAQHDIANGRMVLQETTPSIPILMNPLPYAGGSDRMFFRLKTEESKIIMCASKDAADFERFLRIGKFLDELNLGVPKIYNSSSERHVVIMEDLGDDILFNRINSGIPEEEMKNLYRQIIEWLVDFQSWTYGKYCPEGQEEQGKVGIRIFDFNYLRWETAYFSENFLVNFCGISKDDVDKLDDELCQLAEEALAQPQVMIHRDFQSQNILFKDGKVRIVDFQGARIGHIAYDLMSLLKDPYVSLSRKLRNSLIDHYFDIFRKSRLAGVFDFNRVELAKFAATAALQRNMQALGAYGFLGLKKGKKEYLKHIPRGLEYLKDGLQEFQKFHPDCPLPKLTYLGENLTAKMPSRKGV